VKNLILIAALLISLPLKSQTPEFKWQSLTAKNSVSSCCRLDSLIWFGTSGGLLRYNINTDKFVSFTNTEGLPGNDITSIISDVNSVWVGFHNGIIIQIDHDGKIINRIEDFSGFKINCILPGNDSLWVGHEIGISLYLRSKSEVKETYRQLGQGMSRDQEVKDILIWNNHIWAATSIGIARADLSLINLLDPRSWTNYTKNEGLVDNDINSIEQFGDYIYAAAKGGVARFQSSWETVLQTPIYSLKSNSDLLIAGGMANIFTFDNVNWQTLVKTDKPVTCLEKYKNNIYAGTSSGILRLKNSILDSLQPNAISGKLISDIAVDNNHLWCSTRDNGFYQRKNGQWSSFTKSNMPEIRNNDQYSIFIDSQERLWVGGWGNGLIRINKDESVESFNPENGYLSGIPENSRYAVITDIAEDNKNNVWFLNYYAASHQPLVTLTVNDKWIYFGSSENIGTSFLTCLAVDEFGRKWIGTQHDGIIVYDDLGTPDDKNDDPRPLIIKTSSGLLSNEISSISISRDGTIWIGTSKGVNYIFEQSVQELRGLPADNITSLLVDGNNNIWAGSKSGLNYFNSAQYSWKLFTKSNSPLIDDHITTLGMDYDSGILYIGTNKGLSLLETPFSSPRKTMGSLKVYPNPFLPGEHQYIIIDELAADVSVNIFSAGGYLVRHYLKSEVHGRRLIWNGLSDRGREVPSGIYMIVAVNNDGKTQTGKFAIIR